MIKVGPIKEVRNPVGLASVIKYYKNRVGNICAG